jgi:DNA-binding CsgD family transcriptional regulator
VPTVTLAGALIGRDSELAMLTSRLRDLAKGLGSLVLIEGEPGIGKSSLVRAVIAGAGVTCDVFWGAGDELGQALPLLPILEGLKVREPSDNPRRNTIVRLLRGEVGADRGADVSGALAEQLLALVAEQCEAKPMILVIDDLQWADQATVALWGRLARSTRHMPLLLIGTMRPVPQREDLLALRRSVSDGARITLTPIAEQAVIELVAALVGGDPDENLLHLADGAGGNPLYLTELVAALSRSQSVTITDTGSAELLEGPAPQSLSAAIADRLGFVSAPTREVLRAAALLGVDFAVPDLAIVLGKPVAELVPALEEARLGGVLAASGTNLGFRHPLIRAALYDEIPIPVRAAWHRDAGRALAEAGAQAHRVARQLLWAVDVGGNPNAPVDAWILTWLDGAAELLVGQAPAVAAELLRQAAGSCLVGSDQHVSLMARLADAIYRVGDDQAEQVANEALGHATDPDLIVDLHWTLAQCRMKSGRSDEALAALDLALASPAVSARHRARLLVLAARTHTNLGQVETAERVAGTALEAATDTGDSWAMGWALHVQSICKGMQGQMTDALPLFDRALAVTQAEPALTDLRMLLQINKAITLGNLDRYDEAVTAARQARGLADYVGSVIRLAQARSALGQLLFESGRWDDAMTEVLVLHEDLKEPAAICCDLGVAAAICFHRGEVDDARAHLAAATPHAEQFGNRLVGSLALARSLARERDEEPASALAELTAGFADMVEDFDEIEDLLADAVRLAMEVDDLDTAKTLAGHASALGAGSEVPHRQANALYCRSLIDHDAAGLLEAAERYSAAGRPLARAKALEAAAGEFINASEREAARAAFTGAVEAYSSIGAVADVASLQSRFRAHGIRRGPHSKHRQARTGWESLTPTEMKIAALVEAGMSNPEIGNKMFLSPRTVATHVSHILKKLGVHSRTDIAREAALRTATAK